MTALERMLALSTFEIIKDVGGDWEDVPEGDTDTYVRQLDLRIGGMLMGIMCVVESTGGALTLEGALNRAARSLMLAAETVPDDEDSVRNMDLDAYQDAIHDLLKMQRDDITPEDITGPGWDEMAEECE